MEENKVGYTRGETKIKGMVYWDKEGNQHFTPSYDNIKEEYQLLQGLVLQFYQILDEASKNTGEKTHEGLEAGFWTNKFKEHFNITIKRHYEQ